MEAHRWTPSDVLAMAISVRPLHEYKWRVVAMLWTVSFFNYADRAALFTLFPLLEREMHLSPVQLGLLASRFAWTYGLLAPFSGNLVDRISRKRAVLGGLYAWSTIAACTSLSRGFGQLFGFMAAEGVGESLYYPASMSLLSDYHGPETRSRAMGIHQTSVYVGTIAGGFFAGLIGEQYGWRWSFVTFGGMGLLLGLSCCAFCASPLAPIPLASRCRTARPAASALVHRSIAGRAAAPARLLLREFRRHGSSFLDAEVSLRSVWVECCRRRTLSHFVCPSCQHVRLPPGRMARRHHAKKTAGGRAAVQSAALFCGAPFIVLCSQTREPAVLAFALIAWGLCKGLYDANIFASMFDVVPAEARGTAAGVMNMIGWLCGGTLAPVTIGYLSQRVGLSTALGFTAGVYILGGVVLLLASRFARARRSEFSFEAQHPPSRRTSGASSTQRLKA